MQARQAIDFADAQAAGSIGRNWREAQRLGIEMPATVAAR